MGACRLQQPSMVHRGRVGGEQLMSLGTMLGAAVAELDAKMGPGMVQVRGILCLGLLGCLLSWLLGVCQLLYHCHFFCH